ncbi:terpene synthase family protein [Streptomyces sp. NPDC088350]|uniref:terpene synthase family protein n=1 Tax=Streptomyces sp. NPDC088350 TaxID=3365854 RepID=UPI0037FC31BE
MSDGIGGWRIQTDGQAEPYGERLTSVPYNFPGLEPVHLPGLLLPVRHALSPHLAEVRTAYVDWLVDSELIEPGTQGHDVLLGMKLDECSALTNARCSKDLVFYGALNLALFFLFDDLIDNVAVGADTKLSYLGKLSRIVDGARPSPHDDALLKAWHRWLKESEAYATPALYSAFIADLHRYLGAVRSHILTDQPATVCAMTYLMRRQEDIVTRYFMAHGAIFLAHESGLDIRQVADEQHVRMITDILPFVIVLQNDLIGLYKDVKSGEPNFVTILQREYGLDLQASIDLTGKIEDDMVRSMLQIENDRPRLIDGYYTKQEAISKYLSLAYGIIRGTFDWYMISNRYVDPHYFSASEITSSLG